MVLYRKNEKWSTIHISLDMKQTDDLNALIQQAVELQLQTKKHLKRQWKAIDIVDIKIVSSTFQPTKDTTFVDLLVFVADVTGKQLD